MIIKVSRQNLLRFVYLKSRFKVSLDWVRSIEYSFWHLETPLNVLLKKSFPFDFGRKSILYDEVFELWNSKNSDDFVYKLKLDM